MLKCSWNSNRNCQPIIFDATGNVWVTVGERECPCSNAALGKQKGFGSLWGLFMVSVNAVGF